MMKYESYVMKKSVLFFSLITLCISMQSACGGRSASGSDDINPRDTVTVPEGYTGEDSIAPRLATKLPCAWQTAL